MVLIHFLYLSLLLPFPTHSTAELNLELSRPLKVSPTLIKLEQAKAYLQKVLPSYTWESSSKTPSAFSTPLSSPKKTPQRAFPPRTDRRYEASALGKASTARALSFHKVSLHTTQIVIVMETEACPLRPSVTVLLSAMTACLNMKSGPRIDGKYNTSIFLYVLCCLQQSLLSLKIELFFCSF